MKFIIVILFLLLATPSFGGQKDPYCEFKGRSDLNDLINKLKNNTSLRYSEGTILAFNAPYFVYKLSYEVKDDFEIKRILYNYYNTEYFEHINLEYYFPYTELNYYAVECNLGSFWLTMFHSNIEYFSRRCANKIIIYCSHAAIKNMKQDKKKN